MLLMGNRAFVTGLVIVRRFVASLLVVAATVYLGIVAGQYIAAAVLNCTIDSVAGIKIEWGLTTVAATYLLASFEKVLKLGRTFIDYLAKPSKAVTLYPDCIALMGIVTYVAIAAQAFGRKRECDNLPDKQVSVATKEVIYLSRALAARAEPVEWVPFFFSELAGTEQNPAKGTSLSDQQQNDLSILIGSLRACVGELPGEDVVLDVRGYADSNEFSENSEEQNRKAANRRAAALHETVAALVGGQKGDPGVRLEALRMWPEDDPGAMARESRYFSTRPLKETGAAHDQGLFNRRADLLILRIGVCAQMLKAVPGTVSSSPAG